MEITTAKKLSELLSVARVLTFRSVREQEVLNLIQTIRANDGLPANLSEKIFLMSYSITARLAFGKKCKDQEAFMSVVSELSKMLLGFFVCEFFTSLGVVFLASGLRHKAEKIRQESDRILGDIINDHRESRERAKGRSEEVEEDIVDVLSRLQENGEFPSTGGNIKAISFFIPFGARRGACPGILFALANVELPLAQLLFHFDWKLPKGMNPEDQDTTEAFGFAVKRKNELLIIPTPYNVSTVA